MINLRQVLICIFVSILSTLQISASVHADACNGKRESQRKRELVDLVSRGSEALICYSYNDYGDNVNTRKKDGTLLYPTGEGHGGWDVDFARENTHTFYSLSCGIVMAAGVGKNNVIAVYDHKTQKMVLYLHASHVFVKRGQWVGFGTRLGNQGNRSHQKIGYHVHIEVRKLTKEQKRLPFQEQINLLIKPSLGKGDEDRPTEDPVPYLWEQAGAKRKVCSLWSFFKRR